jgi:Spy/CpxP family protein refolding chaperone
MKTSTLLKGTATAVFVIAGTIGAALWAHDSMAQGGPFAAMHGMPGDGSHLAQMAAHIEAAANATPDQKTRIDALVAQATTDLQAMHGQAGQFHQQLHTALSADVVDRAALENIRLAHMQVADQVSKRLVQLMADVADVLSPDQRRATIAKMQAMHGAH